MTRTKAMTHKGGGASAESRNLIDSRRLLYFFHVAKTGRFLSAEAKLNIAQSAMSRQIQQLEADLGVRLLERTGRGVTLTPAGEILYRDAKQILTRMASTVSEIADLSHPPGSVSIAAPPTFMGLYMARVIERFEKALPGARIRAVEASSGAVMTQLIDGSVDIAIVVYAGTGARVELTEMLTEPMCLLCAPNHPVARQRSIPRRQLRDLDLVIPAALNGHRAILREYFEAGDLPLRSRIEADSLPLTRSLVMQRSLCTILPPSTCREQIDAGALVAIALDPPLTRTLRVARLKERDDNPIADVLVQLLVEVVRDFNAGAPPSRRIKSKRAAR